MYNDVQHWITWCWWVYHEKFTSIDLSILNIKGMVLLLIYSTSLVLFWVVLFCFFYSYRYILVGCPKKPTTQNKVNKDRRGVDKFMMLDIGLIALFICNVVEKTNSKKRKIRNYKTPLLAPIPEPVRAPAIPDQVCQSIW